MNSQQAAFHAPLRQYVGTANSRAPDGLLATLVLANHRTGKLNERRRRITHDPTADLYPAQYILEAGSNVAFQCRDGAGRLEAGGRTIGRRNADEGEPGEIEDREPLSQDELDEEEREGNTGALAIHRMVYT